MKNEIKKLISKKEAAEMLSISTRSLDRLVASNRGLRPVKIGGSIRFRLDQIMKIVEGGLPC